MNSKMRLTMTIKKFVTPWLVVVVWYPIVVFITIREWYLPVEPIFSRNDAGQNDIVAAPLLTWEQSPENYLKNELQENNSLE